MMRHAAAVALALLLTPSWLPAQTTTLVVNAVSVDVHKFPSLGTPVIGRAPRGASLEVTRELGSWVKISWPDAKDGAGYVHIRMGRLAPTLEHASVGDRRPVAGSRTFVQQSVDSIARRSTRDANRGTGLTTTVQGRDAAARTTPDTHVEQVRPVERPASTDAVYVSTPSHVVGLGGLGSRMGGSTLGYGATARAWSWSRNRVGIQFEISRVVLTNPLDSGRLTSVQFAPSLLFSLPDRVSDYVWMRPYIGGGASLSRSTLSGTSTTMQAVSNKKLGFQAFGGAEVTFPTVPRFALSMDVGYQRYPTPYPDFEIGRLRFSLSGHWYVK